MRDHNSQQGSEKLSKSHKEVKRKKGYMALRNNVYDLKLELWHILKPLEYYLVDVIIDKTIKWREKEAVIKIDELKERTKQHHSEIYRALKSLEQKKIIFRRKQNHNLIIGLNEEYFGGLLIKRHEDALLARRSKIKVIVDNSKIGTNILCESSTSFVGNSHKSCADHTQITCEIHTQKDTQVFETIDENRSLNTLLKDISLNTSLQSGEIEDKAAIGKLDFSLLKKPKKSNQCKNPEEEKSRQFAEAKAAGIL